VLSRLVSLHGAPRYLRSNNEPEFVSRAILNAAALPVAGATAKGARWIAPDTEAAIDVDIANSAGSVYIPRGSDGVPIPLPQRAIPGVGDVALPLVEAEGAPHTVLGGKLARDGETVYRLAATFPRGRGRLSMERSCRGDV
jgi:hypothetical protein